MWSLIRDALVWIWNGRKERSEAVFDGWEGLHRSEAEWRNAVILELKICADDRKAIHAELEKCDGERRELTERVDALETKVL